MANHRSAEKRARQNKKRAQRNAAWRHRVKTAIRSFKSLLNPQGKDAVVVEKEVTFTALQNAQRLLQKTVSKGILHRRSASRRISRLAQAWNRAQSLPS
jgi:small subunit ribosomal protein S20